LLFNIFKPLLLSVVKPILIKVIEKQIKDSFNKGDALIFGVQKEAERALAEAKDDPEQAKNIYSRYVNAFQTKMTQGKQKTEEVTANTQTNIAMTQHDSIFKNIKLPGGISTKATEYKDLAAKGDKWESPIFGIGSASRSTNIPKVTPVSRKPHNAASSQTRGGAPSLDGVGSGYQNEVGNSNNSGGLNGGSNNGSNGGRNGGLNSGSKGEYNNGGLSSGGLSSGGLGSGGLSSGGLSSGGLGSGGLSSGLTSGTNNGASKQSALGTDDGLSFKDIHNVRI